MNTDGHRCGTCLGVRVVFALLLSIVSLFLASCRHVEPVSEKRSAVEQIQKHIVGRWVFDEASDGYGLSAMNLEPDGSFIIVRNTGDRVSAGTWKCDGRMLVVAPKANSEFAPSSRLTESDWFPVVYADEHELVIAPGLSVTGRIRFKRQ